MAEDKENDEPKAHEEESGEEFDFETDSDSESDQSEEFPPPAELEGEIEDEIPVEAPPKHKSFLLPLLIGIAVIGFIGWKLFNMLTAPKEDVVKGPPKGMPAQVIKEQPKLTPAPAPVTQVLQPKTEIPDIEQAQEQAKYASVEEKVTATLQKKIDEQLLLQKQQLDTMQKDLAASSQNLANANQIISSLQQEISALSIAVQDLNSKIQGLTQEQIRVKEESKAKKAVKPKKISPKSENYTSPVYSIHAIIPGRAWLRTKDGKTITVAEGDPVGEYGKVLKIDAPNGIVITTSGVTFR